MPSSHDIPIELTWRDRSIGRLVNAVPDMWYLEGDWEALNDSHSRKFQEFTSSFNPKTIMADAQKGTRIQLHCSGEDLGYALVLSLDDQRLLIRRVHDPEAVQWLLSNVE